MKYYRVSTGVLMAFFYLAGRLTGAREWFVLLFTLLCVLLCALLLNLWTLLSFSYVQELSSPASVKGRRRTLRVGIYNDKPFPFTRMGVRVEGVSPRENYLLSFNLPPRNAAHFQIPLTCPYRGLYQVGMTRLEINDLFGLLPLSYDMRRLPYYRQRELKILPEMVEIPCLPSRQGDDKQDGSGGPQTVQDGEAYWGLRQYRPGDTAKRIHWKQSLRRGELLVREYQIPVESGVLLALDTAAWGLEGEEALRAADLACECAAAIAHWNLKAGYPVRLIGASSRCREAEEEQPSGYRRILEWLTILPFQPGEGELTAALERETARTGGVRTIYALTWRPTDQLYQALLEQQAKGYGVCCLVVAPELSVSRGNLAGIHCLRIGLGENVAEKLGTIL